MMLLQMHCDSHLQKQDKPEVDNMATETSDLGTTKQYEPYYLDSSFTIVTDHDTKTQTGAAKSPTIGVDSKITRAGEQTLTAPVN